MGIVSFSQMNKRISVRCQNTSSKLGKNNGYIVVRLLEDLELYG